MNIDHEIRQQLDRLLELKSPRALRERTILNFARAMADGEALPYGKVNGNIGERKYYNAQSDWHGNSLFVEVLENVAQLYRDQDLAIKNANDAEARRKRHEERAALIRKGKGRLVEALELVDVAEASLSQVAQFMKIVFAEERMEFDELPTASARVDVTSDGEAVNVPVIYLPDNGRDSND